MKTRNILAFLLLLLAGIQTAAAQGFRVYKSDGTVAQFSFRTDSIVFYDGIGSDVDFGPFTPVNQCLVGTWYKTKSEAFTFNEDGTTDYLDGATYEFLPYQGTLIINNAEGKLTKLLRVPKVTKDYIVLSEWGGETFAVLTATQPVQFVTGITINPASLTLDVNETATLAATVLPADATDKSVTWTSSNTSVATVSTSGKVTAKAVGTCTVTCAAQDGSGVKAECQVTVTGQQTGINGHAYVEIGGLKWATMNVGATTVAGNYATCYGDYYAWGETQPRYASITRSGTYSASFSWKNGGYSPSNYPTYTGATLDASHDAATANWGGTWRTPKREDFMALAKACSGSDSYQNPVELTSTITSGGIYWLSRTQTIESAYTGVAGLLFVSASDISKRVFFPASGHVYDRSFFNGGTDGDYWSSSLTSYSRGAYRLNFNSSYVRPSDNDNCYDGKTVRPVSD